MLIIFGESQQKTYKSISNTVIYKHNNELTNNTYYHIHFSCVQDITQEDSE